MSKLDKITLLVVDDEPVLREILVEFFSDSGCNVLSASGGIEAFEIICDQKIDFVISDVRMPNGDGVFLLNEIRKRDPRIPPVILVSGFTELNKEMALNLGAIDLLQKPICFDTLEKLVSLNV